MDLLRHVQMQKLFNENDFFDNRILVHVKSVLDYTYIRIETVHGKCQPWWRRNGSWVRIVCYLLCLVLVTYVSTSVRDLNRDPAVIERLETSRLRPDLLPDPIDDFQGFPCFPDLKPDRSLRSNGKCVRILDRGNFRLFIALGESCKYLRMGERTPICSYNSVKNDTSEFYSKEGIGEKRQVEDMIKMLKSNPEMRFMDIGMRAGVYCIAASKVNNRTICLDANYKRLQQTTRSLFFGSIIANALMIWNKLSNKQGMAMFRIPAVREPILLDDFFGESREPIKARRETIKVNMITMNDLVGIFSDEPVFVKIDIGADLELVLQGARYFFKEVNVRIVQVTLTARNNYQGLIIFFQRNGFYPYDDAFGDTELHTTERTHIFPRSIYFLKTTSINV